MTTDTTESRLMEATIALIGERGYKGTTTRQIAERAGVNEVTVFRRFGSKEALVERAIPYVQNQLREAFDATRREKSGDLASLALSMMDVLAEKRETVVAMMFEARREPYVMEAASSMIKFILSFVRECLASYESDGTLTHETLEVVSVSLASFIFFRVVVRERLLDTQFTPQNRREELEDYLRLILKDTAPQGRRVGRPSS